jgi:uncharacterized coiled-coil DUF342 family protein
MKFTSVEQIDEAIVRLEERMSHTSLTLSEEKRVLEDIKALKKSRTAVSQYSDKLEQLASDSTHRDEISGGIKGMDEQLNRIKAREEELRAELAVMRAKDEETTVDFSALMQERDECREVSKAAYEKIKDLRAAHDAVWAEYKEADKAFRVQRDEDRKVQQKAWIEEKARRDAERAAWVKENAPEPFDKEVSLIVVLIFYICIFFCISIV